MANPRIKRNPEAWKAYQRWLKESIAIERMDAIRQLWLEQSVIIAHKKDRRTKYVLNHSRTN